MIEYRYYKGLDEGNVHVYKHTKEQGVPFKVREIHEATLEMIGEERKLWSREHGEMARIFGTVRRLGEESGTSESRGDHCE
jgi:hypothetical protein